MTAARSSHLRGSIVIVAAGLALAIVSGCQKSNGLTPVTGKVTFKGNPVPMGNVYIEPDASQGNKGPQCRSSIIKGVFTSRPEFGSVSGPVTSRNSTNEPGQPWVSTIGVAPSCFERA